MRLFWRRKKKKEEILDVRRRVLEDLRKVFEVIKLIDRSLPNRRARKQFWENFCKRGEVREAVIQDLIKQYEEMVSEKKEA